MKPRLWPVLLASGLGFALLLSLGVWQAQRLTWKQNLLAEIERGLAAPPQDMGTDTLPAVSEFQKLRVTGTYAKQPPLRMIDIYNSGPGWRLLHVFETGSGTRVLVDRGVAPEQASPPPPEGQVAVVGIVKRTFAAKAYFDPANDAANNRWYWWDFAAMQKQLQLNPQTDPAFVLRLLPGEAGTQGLETAAPKASLSNNHLGYAITWFGLAAVLVVMTGLFLHRRRSPAESRDISDQ